MIKSEQMQVAKAKKYAAMGMPSFAANILAIADRSAATTRSRREIRAVINAEGLMGFLCEVNGCLVPDDAGENEGRKLMDAQEVAAEMAA